MLHAKMMSRAGSNWDRDADLTAIEATYERYQLEERDRLWDMSNPGFRRTVVESRLEILRLLSEETRQVGPRVLDVGCGTGDLAGEALDAGLECDWIGIDLRQAAILEARRRYPSARFIKASADAIPLPDRSVDVALAIVLFSSLPSLDLETAVARELRRVIRPGGSLIWFDLRYSNPRNRAVHAMSEDRVRRVFAGWDVAVTSTSLLPPIARRLGRLTSLIYPILRAIAPLRSHLIGRIRRASGA